MRMRECYTLDFTQISIPKRTVHLQRTKNGDNRQVPLTTPTLQAVQAYALAEHDSIRQRGGRLFPFWNGDRSEKEVDRVTAELSYVFREIFAHAEVEHFRFHDLRHEATCRLYEKTNLSDVRIAKVTGHRDLRPGAAGRVHADFTFESARRRLEAELGAEQAAAVPRYSIVNLWRSIRHPVLDAPLAVCDARTVARSDLVASDIFYPERNGEIYQVTYRAVHSWSYFSAMTRDEVLLFKQFDSAPQVACATPHAAFEHPHAPRNAPLRESIEIRCLLVFDK